MVQTMRQRRRWRRRRRRWPVAAAAEEEEEEETAKRRTCEPLIISFSHQTCLDYNSRKQRLLLMSCSSYFFPRSLPSSSEAAYDPYLSCVLLKQIHVNLLRLLSAAERRAVELELDGCGSSR